MPPGPLMGFSVEVTSSRKATLTAVLLIRCFGTLGSRSMALLPFLL